MKLSNPFSQETRNLYLYVYACGDCGRSGLGLELHHIKGRISSSPFNAIPICPYCHNLVTHSDEEHRKYFKINAFFLHTQGYKATEDDLQYISNNPELIDKEFMDWLFSPSETFSPTPK